VKQKGMALWFTGLPCSGKTSISSALHSRLKNESLHSHVLDGDVVRKGLSIDLDFSENGRRENIRRVGEVSKLFVESGLIILVAFISPYRNDRNKVRKIFKLGQFVEVYLECPLRVCEERDVKGMYKKARKGGIRDFTGISSPYEPPMNPEIYLQTHKQDLEECVDVIYRYIIS
jgi:adenylylsulfate kinase